MRCICNIRVIDRGVVFQSTGSYWREYTVKTVLRIGLVTICLNSLQS